ncbi:MAG TPA: ABC transporter substrate-binding protein [Thermoanaerobaculia bacterium]|jgi:branched-chain amino acid transport system substrate-binding protein
MQRTRVSFVLIAVLLLAAPFADAQRRRSVTVSDTVILGGLFSLTGDGATLGRASAAALELAVRDINEELAALRLPYRVQPLVADTQLRADVAREKLAELYEAGARYVIGPQSSAEAGAMRAYANEHRIVLVSQGSTAFSLAIPGDYLFRLAPNDRLEGAAMAALMRADGIDVVVPVWRNDAGNTGLRDGAMQFFANAGGVVHGGVPYDPATTDFASIVATLGSQVRAAKNAHPGATVGVYIAAFEEGVPLLNLARLDADLAGARWYGGDGLTQSQALLADPAIAAFAAATHFTAPAVGLGESTRDRWEPLSAEIHARVGFLPDAFSLSVYDAAWVAILSHIESRGDADVRRESFVRNVQRYWGVTGPLALDAAGDRKLADFDLWTVQPNGAVIGWVRTAQYVSGRLVR